MKTTILGEKDKMSIIKNDIPILDLIARKQR